MAAAATPIINSAQQLEPGVEVVTLKDAEVLNPQRGAEYPPSNVVVEVLTPDQWPNPRPPRISFAALHDPRLRLVRAIPLEVSVEDSAVLVCWSEIDEFGTGATLSTAIDDFADGLSELYHQLFAKDAVLGPNLQKAKQLLGQYIQRR